MFARDDGGLDEGGSLAAVQASPLLRAANVQFVVGSTQQTLAPHQFTAALDLVLLDGPHAWPFPELEYYAVYPHIAAGGLLIVDDIHIPTIHNMWRFLREDPMWAEVELVGTTGFLRRTAAPTFDPLGDLWHEQPYNSTRYPVALWPWRVRAARRTTYAAKRAVFRVLPPRMRTLITSRSK